MNAGVDINATGAINVVSIFGAGTLYTDGTYPFTSLTGGTGENGLATIIVTGGKVVSVEITYRGLGYTIGDTLSADLPVGSGFELNVVSVQSYVSLYQHEIGTNAIIGGNTLAINSFFETNNLGWTTGGPATQSLVGDNFWLRLERVEPDFVQTGEMSLVVSGRPYAQAEDQDSAPYVFSPDTHKIDMKEQRRELRLRFTSNVVNGDYQLGYVLLVADIGDVRGY